VAGTFDQILTANLLVVTGHGLELSSPDSASQFQARMPKRILNGKLRLVAYTSFLTGLTSVWR
jgi:hypothetical protein